MQYEGALHNDLWGAAIFPGAGPWTVVKTAPFELLAERRPGATEVRLAELCASLSSSAVQVNVYDGVGIVLMEVSPGGRTLLSGFSTQGGDPFRWHEERLEEALARPRLQLHAFPDVSACTSPQDIAEALARRLGGANERYCDNLVSVETLIGHGTLTANGGVVSYFRWTGPSRLRSPR